MYNFDLGRNALKYLINLHKIEQIYIPYYLCDVIRHAIVEKGCKPIFYHLDDDFMPVKNFTKEDFVLYPNYFGVCSNNVKKLASIYPKLIVDNAHAYYDEPNGFACFYCGHKFGYNGAELYIDMKNLNIKTRIELNKADVNERRQKFLELHEQFNNINLLQLNLESIPFVYPCLAETQQLADKIVEQQQSMGKTIYRYWNNMPKSYNEYKFYSRLVPIPLY